MNHGLLAVTILSVFGMAILAAVPTRKSQKPAPDSELRGPGLATPKLADRLVFAIHILARWMCSVAHGLDMGLLEARRLRQTTPIELRCQQEDLWKA